MANQIIYNLMLFVMGYIFLFGLSSIGRLYRCVISYVIGLALWGIVSTLIIFSQVKLNIYSVMCMYFMSVGILYYSKFRNLEFKRWKDEFLVCGVGCVVMILLTLFFYKNNFITLSPDSYQYVFYGWRIEEVGYFNENLYEWGVGGAYDLRMPFLPSIYAGSRMVGVDFFYTCFPIAGMGLLLLLPCTVFELSSDAKISKIVWASIGILSCLTLLTIPTFWEQIFYVNNHLLVSIYFLISFASILFFDKESRNDWLVLAAICLGVSILQRQEMFVFASSVILLLLCCSNLNRKDYAVFLGIFTIVVLPWIILRITITEPGAPSTGGGLLQLSILCLYLLSYFVIHFVFFRTTLSHNFGKIFFSVLVIFLVIFLKMETDPLTASINGVLTLMGSDHYVRVYWGITWLVLILCALTDVMILKSERGMKFLSVIASFLIFRILLFGSSLSHVAGFHLTTGN
ncbi:MAG: hypothetical protein HOK72_03665, partial [Flavobacteriales bacterium]|nr:hypothetical protein [Flavobacteriales bacterium]